MSVGTELDSGPRQSSETSGKWALPRDRNKAQCDFNRVFCYQHGERSCSVSALVSHLRRQALFCRVQRSRKAQLIHLHVTPLSQAQAAPRALVPLLINN